MIPKATAAIRYTADRTKRYNEHGFTLLQLGIRGVVYFNTRDDVADALTGLMDFYYEWSKDKLTIARHERGHRDIKKGQTDRKIISERTGYNLPVVGQSEGKSARGDGNAKRVRRYQRILLFRHYLYCRRFGK